MLGDPLAGEEVGDPVVQHEERRDTSGVALLAKPEEAREREDVRRRVSGERVQARERKLLEQLRPFERGARIEVRTRVEDLARRVDEHASLALARRDDTTNASVRGELSEHRAHAAGKRAPERHRIQVEAAEERQVRVAEDPIVERLLRGGDRASGEVEGDRAAGARSGVERDDDVAHAAQSRRSRTAGLAIQPQGGAGRSPASQRSIASTMISL